MSSRNRNKRLIFFRTAGNIQRVNRTVTDLEKVFRIELGRSCKFLSPTAISIFLRTIGVLKLRHHTGSEELRIGREVYFQSTGCSFFGIDDNYPIGGGSTIKSSGRRSCQNGNRLNIFSVKVGNSFSTSRTSVFAAIACTIGIADRHTVYHIEHVIVTRDRLGTAHNNACSSTYPRRRTSRSEERRVGQE